MARSPTRRHRGRGPTRRSRIIAPDSVDARRIATRSRHPRNPAFEDDHPALGVWVPSTTNVYAWYANTVYHGSPSDAGVTGVGGAVTWTPDTSPTTSNPTPKIRTSSNTSTSSARRVRGRRRLVLRHARPLPVRDCPRRPRAQNARRLHACCRRRRTERRWQRPTCEERRGVFMIGGRDGWLTDTSHSRPIPSSVCRGPTSRGSSKPTARGPPNITTFLSRRPQVGCRVAWSPPHGPGVSTTKCG